MDHRTIHCRNAFRFPTTQLLLPHYVTRPSYNWLRHTEELAVTKVVNVSNIILFLRFHHMISVVKYICDPCF